MSEGRLARAARDLQERLESFYALEPGPDITDFVFATAPSEREQLLVQHEDDEVALALYVPEATATDTDVVDDAYLQLVEGVSHFVYVTERARTDLPATELELELQAEVDKFVLLAFDGQRLANDRATEVLRALHDNARYVHPDTTERGIRYRLATHLAARLSARMLHPSRAHKARSLLQRFYRSGQGEKIRIASA